VFDNQIKDETTIGGAIEVWHPIDLTDRVQARPFGKMRTGLQDMVCLGLNF